MRYSDEFRASAVALLVAAGYPNKRGALQGVADRLGIPHQTLARWATGRHNPPPAALVEAKRAELAEVIHRELLSILEQMAQVRGTATYADLVLSAGILLDKLRLLDGDVTANVHQSVALRPSGLAPGLDELDPVEAVQEILGEAIDGRGGLYE